MNKNQIEARLQKLEEQRSRNPVKIIDLTDNELQRIIGIENPTDAQLEEIARGAEVLLIDDIREAEP